MRVKDPKKIDQIYQAVIELTSEIGIAGITMSGVAKRAGIGTGTLYTYYVGKEELFQSTYEKCTNRYLEHLFKPGMDKLTLRQKLKSIFTGYIVFGIERHREIVFQDQFFYSPYALGNKKIAWFTEQALEPYTQVVTEGITKGILKKLDHGYYIMLLLGLGNQFSLSAKIGLKPPSKELLEVGFSLFWGAIEV